MPKRSGTSYSEGPLSDDPDEALLQRIVSILRDERLRRGITLRELAARMKVDNAHLSRTERGLVYPGFVVLLRWCRAFDKEVEGVLREARKDLGKGQRKVD